MTHFLYWPRLLMLILGMGSLVALVAIGFETGWGRQIRRNYDLPAMRAASAPSAAMVPAYSLPLLEQGFAESAARPLFMPTRRPVPAAVSAPVMKRGQFLLVGTSRTKEFGDSAMLKDVSGAKTYVVKAGETIQNMTVKTIAPDRVVLALGDESEEVVMKVAGSPKQAPVAIGGPGPLGAGQGVAPAAGVPQQGQQPNRMPAASAVPPSNVMPAPPVQTPAQIIRPQGVAPPAAQQPSADGSKQLSPFEEILERRRRARAQQAQPSQ